MPSSQSHKKYPVCCFGEVLIDFLQDKAQPGLFHRFAGGAPANVAVAVARLGGQSKFIGMLGKDIFGDFCCRNYKIMVLIAVLSDKLWMPKQRWLLWL